MQEILEKYENERKMKIAKSDNQKENHLIMRMDSVNRRYSSLLKEQHQLLSQQSLSKFS